MNEEGKEKGRKKKGEREGKEVLKPTF